MLHNTIHIRSLRGKRIFIVHWAQCAVDAHEFRELLLPIANRVDMLSVSSQQQLRENIFRELSHHDVVILFGHDAVTKQCMTIHMNGREQSYLVSLQ